MFHSETYQQAFYKAWRMDVNSSMPGHATPMQTQAFQASTKINSLLSLLLTCSCRLFLFWQYCDYVQRMASRCSFIEITPSVARQLPCQWQHHAPPGYAGPPGSLCKRKEDKISSSSRSLFSVWSSASSTRARIKCCLLFEVCCTVHSALKHKAYFLRSFL